MGFVFLICIAVMFILGASRPSIKGLAIDAGMFKVSSGFATGAAIIVAMLVVLYTVFW